MLGKSNPEKDQPIDDRLLDTAIEQFGALGIEGASTRAIAAAAGTAMSSITYHYGGKEGLYRAAAGHIVQKIRAGMQAPLASSIGVAADDEGADAAIEALLTIIEGFAHLMTSPHSAAWARFIVREQMAPTPAFDILYSGTIESLAGHVITLVRRIAGNGIDDEDARLVALSLFGQAMVFRVARATVLRVTGWSDVGDHEGTRIRRMLRQETRAILEALRGGRP